MWLGPLPTLPYPGPLAWEDVSHTLVWAHLSLSVPKGGVGGEGEKHLRVGVPPLHLNIRSLLTLFPLSLAAPSSPMGVQ